MTFDIQSHQIILKDQYIVFCLDSSSVLFSILMQIVYGGLDFYLSFWRGYQMLCICDVVGFSPIKKTTKIDFHILDIFST